MGQIYTSLPKESQFYSSEGAGNATAQFRVEAFPPQGGPLRVNYANYAEYFSSWIQGSLNEIGIPSTDNFNSGSLIGAQYCSSTINPPPKATACTCRMGKEGDPNAVVDSKAKVFGVKGLKVVDTSGFAFLRPGHPQRTIYAPPRRSRGIFWRSIDVLRCCYRLAVFEIP